MSRANAISAFYLFSYLGTGIPVVLAGLLSLLVTTIDSSVYTAVLLALIIIITAFATVALIFGKSPQAPRAGPAPGSGNPGRGRGKRLPIRPEAEALPNSRP